MLTVSSLAVAIGTGRVGAALWELPRTHQGVKLEPDGWSVVWTAGEKWGISFPALQAWPLAPAIVSRSPPLLRTTLLSSHSLALHKALLAATLPLYSSNETDQCFPPRRRLQSLYELDLSHRSGWQTEEPQGSKESSFCSVGLQHRTSGCNVFLPIFLTKPWMLLGRWWR